MRISPALRGSSTRTSVDASARRRAYGSGGSAIGRVVTASSARGTDCTTSSSSAHEFESSQWASSTTISTGAAAVSERRIDASRSLVFSARTLPSIAAVSSLSGMPTATMLLSSGRRRRSCGSHGTCRACGSAIVSGVTPSTSVKIERQA